MVDLLHISPASPWHSPDSTIRNVS